MNVVQPLLLVAVLLGGCLGCGLWFVLTREERLERRRQEQKGRKTTERNSGFSDRGGNKASIAFFAAMTALTAIMIWAGLINHHLPEWLLWATTVL